MKKKQKIISILIFISIIIIVICSILLKTYLISDEEKKIKKGYQVLGEDYCEGHSLSRIAGDALTPWTCKICGYSAVNPDTAAPKICSECAEITKRCMTCGKLKSDKLMEQQQLRSKLFAKYNNFGIVVDKMTYIPQTDTIAFLTINYDSDKLTYPNKIVIVNMNDYSTVNTINLSKDYTLEYDFDYENLTNSISKESDFNELSQKFEQEHEKKYDYEKQGRFLQDDEYLILINPQKEKSFIYNSEKNQMIDDFEWNTGEYENQKYIYMKNIYNQKEYYYFEEYDLIKTSLEGLNLNNYYTDPYQILTDNYYDAQIVYQDGLHLIIAYYEKEYGDIKLNFYDSSTKSLSSQQINTKALNDSKIVLYNKNLILKYNIKDEKEIWSYDINVINKAYERD